MTVDYDLVVIGNSAAGIYAAIKAARLKARVALVEQQISDEPLLGTVSDRVLAEIGTMLGTMRRGEGLGILNPASSTVAFTQLVEQANQWSRVATAAIAALRSPAVLSTLGIEVIAGQGEFYRKPTLGFTVNGRSLRSRAYLIAAVPFRPVLPDVYNPQELQAIEFITADHALLQLDKLKRPGNLVLIGAEPKGVELAQTLNKLGFQVTLMVRNSHILPTADPEAAYLIQAQLEAEGIEVLTRTTVTQIKQIQGKKWVQTAAWSPESGEIIRQDNSPGNLAIETDGIVLATGQKPDLAALNLEAAGITWNESEGLALNQKLQTDNPRIYVCAELSGNHSASDLELCRAKVAVNNALFFPISKFLDQPIPRIVNSTPELAGIGLTEPAAIARYGKDVWVLRQYFKTLPQAQIQGDTGFCKLIVRRNGDLLGAHLVGPHVSELISPIALVMQQNRKVQTLAKLNLPSSVLSIIISQTAAEWHHLKLTHNRRSQDLLECLFDWWRSWR
ncbi:NAD(P)/FAD-dependent oxidoreductase [Kovacikia minuta CCNUW1]|uniref:FAD-dependent oxidoreductase n=1 Tax=Kovacikia minuta TaxID=2931930 RepID=UPI001CC947B6|nr:NAD(P)/FAD-dependent oxidoreductase [Kovacikia minuta]UBF26972.1 NAD(P)/FAD-dependent oxidoreductase [Kovacikia minuta CCNUW1]